jgi:hypothetical protein
LALSRDNDSALSLSLESNNFLMVHIIVDYIEKEPTRDNCIIFEKHLDKLNRMHVPKLASVYNSILIPTSFNIPRFIDLKKKNGRTTSVVHMLDDEMA